jgi:hypothetical protein
MAAQKILLLSIAGLTANKLWETFGQWERARTVSTIDEWSSSDWPHEIHEEVDSLIEILYSKAFMPPVLYRSEHFDGWSMSDVYQRVIFGAGQRKGCMVLSKRHEMMAAWFDSSESIILEKNAPAETRLLHTRVREAMSERSGLSSSRLIILIRTVFAGSVLDGDATDALQATPSWWPQ